MHRSVFTIKLCGSDDVITIDPTTVGTLYNTFTAPRTNNGGSFSGAGVIPKGNPIS